MSVIRFASCLLLFAVSSLPITSHAQSDSAMAFLVRLSAGATRAERVAAAKLMLEHVRYVSSTLPTIKPSERLWVAEEHEAIRNVSDMTVSNNRMAQLTMSPEYQALELDLTLRNLSDALACATDLAVSARREVYCWSVAAYHLDYPDLTYAVGKLRSSGRMARVNLTGMGRGAADEDDSLAAFYRRGARNIQADIVLPYLKSESR